MMNPVSFYLILYDAFIESHPVFFHWRPLSYSLCTRPLYSDSSASTLSFLALLCHVLCCHNLPGRVLFSVLFVVNFFNFITCTHVYTYKNMCIICIYIHMLHMYVYICRNVYVSIHLCNHLLDVDLRSPAAAQRLQNCWLRRLRTAGLELQSSGLLLRRLI